MEELETRIIKLEQIRYGRKDVDASMRRARESVERKGIYSAVWKWVPDNYYEKTLEQRSKILGAPSVRNLCKSLVLENRAWAENGNPQTNPRFVMVVVQYAATLDVKKLTTAIRALRTNVQDRIDVSKFDFRVASSEDNDRLTGYSHNSVTPFGLLEEKSLPIVLASSIVPEKFFWMGGGHIHLKLGMAVSDFSQATGAVVADISHPRTGDLDADE
eukprot:CAMPEP_0195258498 /NCGR_PEP_ID=MMETSP0706-20130129/7437_1 /TAXON_ID=33640 /ORGANISM="Asterionellopsis glacialis, Strain CCMP134" /LENGTH=215 /DNA_ID=CAMNT_0040311883 /DNA_START=52 /DNA_END=699 /DNA_ORIENTATION=+